MVDLLPQIRNLCKMIVAMHEHDLWCQGLEVKTSSHIIHVFDIIAQSAMSEFLLLLLWNFDCAIQSDILCKVYKMA